MSDDALSVLVPILEEIAGYDTHRIRAFLENHGLAIQEWDKARTDWLRIESGTLARTAGPDPVPLG